MIARLNMVDPARLAFGQRLRRARQARQWSRSALAREAGVTRNTVAALEAGGRHPQPTTVAALARALQMPEADLFGAPGLAADDPRLAQLNEEDVAIAHAFHHAPTAVKARVLHLLQAPASREVETALTGWAARVARLENGQRDAVLRLILEFERMWQPRE